MIVSLSGGLDSTVLLATLVRSYADVKPVSFLYGSKHNREELLAARKVATHFGLEHPVVDVRGPFMYLKSALLDPAKPVPEGHYEAESMRATVVPGRNMVFASILAAFAESEGRRAVYLGTHAGDHFIYPDCRPDFFYALAQAVRFSSDGKVKLEAPFLGIDKADIVKIGLEIGAPFHLTRTCYSSNEVACGKCGSCNERREAFAKCGVEDPIPYQYTGPIPTKEVE